MWKLLKFTFTLFFYKNLVKAMYLLFTKEVTKELISRKIVVMRVNFPFFYSVEFQEFFCQSDFTWNWYLAFLSVKKCHFNTFQGSGFGFWWFSALKNGIKSPKYKFWLSSIVEMVNFKVLISRKIWFQKNYNNFHTVLRKLRNFHTVKKQKIHSHQKIFHEINSLATSLA